MELPQKAGAKSIGPASLVKEECGQNKRQSN
jgi:hypothetical protein